MEKISGILPARPRILTEKEKPNPVRPGAPAFGRPEGSNAIKDKVTLSSIKNIGTQDLTNYKNPREAKNVKMIDEMSRKFFMNDQTEEKKQDPSVGDPATNPIVSKDFEGEKYWGPTVALNEGDQNEPERDIDLDLDFDLNFD